MGSDRLTLEEIGLQLDRLPLLPAVVFELMRSDPESDDFFDRMLGLAQSDPPLAALVMSAANSVAYRPSGRIDSLAAALARVGSRAMLELLISLSVRTVFVPRTAPQREIWQHSLEVANIAAFTASHRVPERSDIGTAYMAGLLHDIGRFVLFQVAPGALDDTDANGWCSPTELVEVEDRVVGINHTEVGYLACRRLGLPRLICNIVHHHHRHAIVVHPKIPPQLRDLSLVVQFSDALSILTERQSEWRDWSVRTRSKAIREHCLFADWGDVSLPVDEVSRALPDLIEKSRKSAAGLGL